MASFSGVNICLYGLNRSLSLTINSIRNRLLAPLEGQGCEVSLFGAFCQTEKFSNTRSGESCLVPEKNERSLIDFIEVKYIDQGALDDLIRWDLVFQFGDTYSEINGNDDLLVANSTTKNIFRSLFALKTAYDLIPVDLLDRPTIFVRPDLEILSDLDFDVYYLLLFKKAVEKSFGKTDGVALVPNWHSWHGLNDRFAICSPGNASKAYANRFDDLIPYIRLSRHPLHSETYLYQVMHAARVEVLPMISTKMSRIRANGRPQDENFLVGRQSVDLQSETLSALNEMLRVERRRNSQLRKACEELKRQASANSAELLKEKQGRKAGADRVKALEEELAFVVGERDLRAKEKEQAREEAALTLLHLNRLQEDIASYAKLKIQIDENSDKLDAEAGEKK